MFRLDNSTSIKLLQQSNKTTINYLPIYLIIILEYSDWNTRGKIMRLSKQYWNATNSDLKFYCFLCSRLSIEHHLYIPNTLPSLESWKDIFNEMFHLKSLWTNHSSSSLTDINNQKDMMIAMNNNQPKENERFKINVYTRFRPSEEASKDTTSTNASKESNDSLLQGIEVTLPLHQRLSMIKMSRKLTNNREALKILTSEGGWFQEKWQTIHQHHEASILNKLQQVEVQQDKASDVESISHTQDTVNNENTKYYIANKTTKNSSVFDADQSIPSHIANIYKDKINNNSNTSTNYDHKHNNKQGNSMISCVSNIDTLTGRVLVIAPDIGLREFSFNSVYNVKASQNSVYNGTMRRLVMDFINGFNSTAIVYGQTGSGKTYTMFGKDNYSIYTNNNNTNNSYSMNNEGNGLVPRACEEIFHAIHTRKKLNDIDPEIYISYIEIFGEHVSDLLNYGIRCGHSKVASQSYVLNGAAEKQVTSMKDIEEILKIGEQQKRRAATAMNTRSSRAHALFIVTLKQKHIATNITVNSRLFMADLGGSEQVKKSQVHAGTTRDGLAENFSLGFELGEHMREAVNINLGLLALKKCIESLNNQANYTPYQDSKLTMLLSQGLGGNCKTSVILCANTDPTHISETIATLRFGEKCALIENSARNNATILASILADLDDQISILEKEITRKEKWELKNELRADELAEEGTYEKMSGGIENKKVYVLVGAEHERQQLEKLLLQRAKYFGVDDMDNTTEERKTHVLGFGKEYAKLYGIGENYDESKELTINNSRFNEQTDVNEMPIVVKNKIGMKGWEKSMINIDNNNKEYKKLELKAKKIKRNKLAYSGISYSN